MHTQFRGWKGKQDYQWRSGAALRAPQKGGHGSRSSLATNTTGPDAEGSFWAVSVHYCNTQVQP